MHSYRADPQVKLGSNKTITDELNTTMPSGVVAHQ